MPKKTSDETFSKNFITNVAFEIRFIPLLKISDKISEIQEKIRNKLPIVEYGFPIKISSVGNFPEELNEWKFSSKNREKVLRITVSRLTYIEIKYTTFNEFFSNAMSIIKDFAEITQIKEFNRLGLRYNNEYPLKEKKIDELVKLFNSYIDIEKLRKIPPDSFSIEYRWSEDTSKVTCWNVFSTNTIGNFIYTLDIDAYTESDTNLTNLEGVSNELHKLAKDAFQENITDSFRKILRGKN